MPDISDLPLVFRGATTTVAADDELATLIDDLRRDGTFAYDSEFIGELTYHPQLCLVQVASRNRVALVDPMAQLDLTPFWELLADPAVEKIVHAGEQDIEPVVRHLNRPAANVFDTQIAAGFIGLPYPISLSKLVSELTGAKLGKGLTFSHWDQRPLSEVQLRYAADDVRYLPAAAAELHRRLDALQHRAWAQEESAGVCAPDLYRFDPQSQYLRVRGATSLQPRQLAILRELTIWRDSAARAADLPPRSFLRDEVLIDLSRNPPRGVEALAKVRGLPRPVEHEHGGAIVAAAARAMSLTAVELPSQRDSEPTPVEKFRADAIFSITQTLCSGMSIDPSLVASRQEVGEFYRYLTRQRRSEKSNAADPDTSGLPRLLQGWRREAVGDKLAQFLAGTSHIDATWSNDALRTTVVAIQ